MDELMQLGINVLEMTKRVIKLFDTANPEDIEWFYVDESGNVVTYMQPNIAKIAETIKGESVSRSELAEYTYSKNEIDDKIEATITDLGRANSVPSRANIEAIKAWALKTFEASGFVCEQFAQNSRVYDWGKCKFSPSINKNSVNISYIARPGVKLAPFVHINGKMHFLLRDNWNYTKTEIKLPEAITLKGEIDDLTNCPELIPGEAYAVTDNLTNYLWEVNEGNTNVKYTAIEDVNISWDSTEAAMKIEATDASNNGYSGIKVYTRFNLLEHNKYTFSINLKKDTDIDYILIKIPKLTGGYFVYNIPLPDITDYTTFNLEINMPDDGSYGNYIFVYFHTSVSGETNNIYVKSMSIVNKDKNNIVIPARYVPAGKNLLEGTDDPLNTAYRLYLYGSESVSRQDLVIIESWEEEVDTRDVVFPYGSVQYTGSYDLDATLYDLADGSAWFDDWDAYTAFGAWDRNDPNKKVKAYKWSELSEADKAKFAGDIKNMTFLDDGVWKQIRWRFRVIPGAGNTWRKIDPDEPGNAYIDPISYGKNKYTHVRPQGGEIIDEDMTTWGNGCFFASNSGYVNKIKKGGWYNDGRYSDYLIDAIIVGRVQRYNNGVYHPVLNPEGTALGYDKANTTVLYPADVMSRDDLYATVADCFDPDKIAAKDSDGNFVELSNSSAVNRTGSVDSGISALKEEKTYKFYDIVRLSDLIDDRISAYGANPEQILRNVTRNLTNTYTLPFREPLHERSYIIDRIVTRDFHIGLNRSYANYIYQATPDRFYIIIDGELIQTKDGWEIIVFDNMNNVVRFYGGSRTTGQSVIFERHKDPNALYAANKLPWTNGTNVKLTVVVVKRGTLEATRQHVAYGELFGDPRKLSDRVKYNTSTTDKVFLTRGDYILCTDADNNNGTAGHYYRYMGNDISNVELNGTDGTANASDGHVDFSDTNVWKDLGTDGSIGGLPERFSTGLKGRFVQSNELFRFDDSLPLPQRYTLTTYVTDYDSDGTSETLYRLTFNTMRPIKGIVGIYQIKPDGTVIERKTGLSLEEKFNGEGADINTSSSYIYINLGQDPDNFTFDIDQDFIYVVYNADAFPFRLSTETAPSIMKLHDNCLMVNSTSTAIEGRTLVNVLTNKKGSQNIQKGGKVNLKTFNFGLTNILKTTSSYYLPWKYDLDYISSLRPYDGIKYALYAWLLGYHGNRHRRATLFLQFKSVIRTNGVWGDTGVLKTSPECWVDVDANGRYSLTGRMEYKTRYYLKGGNDYDVEYR